MASLASEFISSILLDTWLNYTHNTDKTNCKRFQWRTYGPVTETILARPQMLMFIYLRAHHNIIFLYHPDCYRSFPLSWGKHYNIVSIRNGELSVLTKFIFLEQNPHYKSHYVCFCKRFNAIQNRQTRKNKLNETNTNFFLHAKEGFQ